MIKVTLSDWELMFIVFTIVVGILFGVWAGLRWVERRFIDPWHYRRLAKRWGMPESEVKRLFDERKLQWERWPW